MAFRIYVDESGTHGDEWLIIGMLFVPNHGPLHSALCKAKDDVAYFNQSPKSSAKYKEIHLTAFRSPRDLVVAKKWIELFVQHDCYYRCVVIDWSLWDGNYFGDPFEPDALKRRRGYKKWAEMLLHPELKSAEEGRRITNAAFYLDRLRIMAGYDVLDHLKSRFTRDYEGENPRISSFQHTDSWRDANQSLQLCDLLTGCLYQELKPSSSPEKLGARDHLARCLLPFGVKSLAPGFWKGFTGNSLNTHLPKYSAWFWRPTKEGRKKRRLY